MKIWGAALTAGLAILFAAASTAQVAEPKEKILTVEEIPTHNLFGTINIRAVAGDSAMMVFNEFDKGAEAPVHNHPNEQITYVLHGRMKFFVGDREHILGAGQLIVVPAFVPHGAEALEATTTIESFAPIRADWREFTY